MLASVVIIIVVPLSLETLPALIFFFFFLFSLYWPQVYPVVSDALVVPGFHSGRLQGFSEFKALWLFGKPVQSHPSPRTLLRLLLTRSRELVLHLDGTESWPSFCCEP